MKIIPFNLEKLSKLPGSFVSVVKKAKNSIFLARGINLLKGVKILIPLMRIITNLIKQRIVPSIDKLKGEVQLRSSAIKTENLTRVFRNPWVIANGVILFVALVMTVIVVSWFKTKTKRLDTALAAMDRLQHTREVEETVKGIPPTVFGYEKSLPPPVPEKHEHYAEAGKEKMYERIYEIGEGSQKRGDKIEKRDEAEVLIGIGIAERLFDAGRYEEALAFYKDRVHTDDELVQDGLVNLRIGECYYHLGLYKDAIKVFQAISDNNHVKEVYRWRSRHLIGECYVGLGDYDLARRTFYKLIAVQGECPPDAVDLIKGLYFRIADLYLQEAQKAVPEGLAVGY